MIQFKLADKDYEIGDITIGQYYKIQHLLALQSADAKLEIVSHLSGCPVNDLKRLPKFNFLQLFHEISEGPLNASADKKLYKHIGLNGKAYGLLEFSKISIGEFADMDVLQADPMKESKLHVMMAIIYRPATVLSNGMDWVAIEPYDSDNLMQRAEEFLDLPLKHVHSALSFFLQIPNFLLENINHSLIQEMEMMMEDPTMTKEELELVKASNLVILESLEDGVIPSNISQETISLKLTKLLELAQSQPLTGLLTRKTKPESKKNLIED